VESLLGAVHVDRVLRAGKGCVAFCRQFGTFPERWKTAADQAPDVLLEFGGELVPAYQRGEEEEYAQAKRARLSEGKRLARSARDWEVASVQCLGVDLVSVSDVPRQQIGHAQWSCALEGNPALLNRHKGCSKPHCEQDDRNRRARAE
jgi:hypothetical protein